MLQVSTGFKTSILGPYSFEAIFNGGCIEIYSGGRPDRADDPAVGTLLGRFTRNGGLWTPGNTTNGLQWVRSGPSVFKPFEDIWAVNPAATGVATWFRIVTASPGDNVYSVTAPRIDGDISSAPLVAEMRLLNPVLTIGTVTTLDHFLYTIPPIDGV